MDGDRRRGTHLWRAPSPLTLTLSVERASSGVAEASAIVDVAQLCSPEDVFELASQGGAMRSEHLRARAGAGPGGGAWARGERGVVISRLSAAAWDVRDAVGRAVGGA